MRTVQLELLRPGEILAERERCSTRLPAGRPAGVARPRHALRHGRAAGGKSLARCAAERTGGVVMPTLFIGTERERPASILRDKGFENPEQLYVLGMDVPKNSMKSFYAREDMFAVIVREHPAAAGAAGLPAHRDRQRPRRVGADLDARTAGR